MALPDRSWRSVDIRALAGRVDGCDAVVNLAGHNVFADRWNTESSASCATAACTARSNWPPRSSRRTSARAVFIQGSAIGFYGAHGDEELDESAASGSDLLAVICRECEEASAGLEGLGVGG